MMLVTTLYLNFWEFPSIGKWALQTRMSSSEQTFIYHLCKRPMTERYMDWSICLVILVVYLKLSWWSPAFSSAPSPSIISSYRQRRGCFLLGPKETISSRKYLPQMRRRITSCSSFWISMSERVTFRRRSKARWTIITWLVSRWRTASFYSSTIGSIGHLAKSFAIGASGTSFKGCTRRAKNASTRSSTSSRSWIKPATFNCFSDIWCTVAKSSSAWRTKSGMSSIWTRRAKKKMRIN